MNPLGRFWHWLRRLFRRRPKLSEEERRREELARAQLIKQQAEKATDAALQAWTETKRALTEAAASGAAAAIERARSDERAAREAYEAAKAAERAVRGDVDTVRGLADTLPDPPEITDVDLDLAMEQEYRKHKRRLAQQETLVLRRAIHKELQRELAQASGVVHDDEPPEALVILDADQTSDEKEGNVPA